MTILCPEEFHTAVQHAIAADTALDGAVYYEQDEKKKKELSRRRGQAVKTLLSCFGYRANSDALDNNNPYFPSGSEIRFENGTVRTINDMDNLPLRETFVSADFAPYSFFFRECYIDRMTRQRVEVYDRCWYVFPEGQTKEEAESLTDEQCEDMAGSGVIRLIYSYDAISKELATNSNLVYVERMKRRVGMCGGIIYHPDYEDGTRQCTYGSYSTHT